jgi:ABC-type nitrate/sulfonate/bicarbonate transport system substrate-binding protein
VKIAIPDLVSPSYFSCIAAVELGLFAKHGADVALEVISPIDAAYGALRDGMVDFVGGSSHSAVSAFPGWNGVKLVCAQGQGMYWFLVVRADIDAERGNLAALKGCRIGAAPWVRLGLQGLLLEAGVEPDAVEIVPIPGAVGRRVNYGVTAAQALADRTLDGFWANGMGAELAVRRGVGRVLLDVRRGDGPPTGFDFTMATIATTDALIQRSPDSVAAAVRAITEAQRTLAADTGVATDIARTLFPPEETDLIAELIRRDLPYYSTAIPEASVEGMLRFSRTMGILKKPVAYEQVVATQFRPLWAG